MQTWCQPVRDVNVTLAPMCLLFQCYCTRVIENIVSLPNYVSAALMIQESEKPLIEMRRCTQAKTTYLEGGVLEHS